MVGQSIGKYRVVDRIGKGGMGTVYRALDEMLHRDVAIKVLNAELNDPEVAKRFRAEAITVARLSHPGIATIYELFEHQGEWLMVMEFVRGETLESMVTRMGPLSPQRSAELCMQALAALAHAHSMGVVHRDLKPANLMITENGAIKVMDFGIARVSGSEHLTNAGFMMGTPAYMAPEQVRGGDVDARADLYAMGVVFYRLATAKLPFKGDTAFAMVQSQVNEPPTPVGLVRAGLPGWVEEIVVRALAKPVEERFQSAAEFHEAFARCLAGLPISSMYAVGDTSLTPSRMVSGAFPMRPTSSASFPMPTGSQPIMSGGTNPASGDTAYDTDRTMMAQSGEQQVTLVRSGPVGLAGAAGASGPVAGSAGSSGPVAPVGPAGPAGTAKTTTKKPFPILWVGVGGAAVVAIGIAAMMFSGRGAGVDVTPTPTPTPTIVAEATPTSTPDPVAAGPATTATPTATPATPATTGTQPPRGAGTTVGPAGTPGASPTPARGATPASTDVPTGRAGAPAAADADLPLTFADNRMVEVQGNRGTDRDIVLNFGGGQIMIMPKSGGASLAALTYKRITRATYVRARDPKWDVKLASPPDGLDIGGMLRTRQHWLVLQGADHFEILQLKDSNVQKILEALEARTGIKVDRPSGEK